MKYQRIVQKINWQERLSNYCVRTPLEIETEDMQGVATHAAVYVFSRQSLQEFVDEVVRLSYDEMFELLKRTINNDKS